MLRMRTWRAARRRSAPSAVVAMLLAVVGGGCAPAALQPPVTAAPAAASAAPAATAAPLTVIVTRHAERADDGTTRDPELSEAGHARARALADALAHAGVDAVLTTQYVRTRATAAPLAARLGVAAEVVESTSGATSEHITALHRAVLARPSGSVVLVVGHSNTVPLLVRELTGQSVPDMPESEYGTLFIVTLPGGAAPARLIRATYLVPPD